MSTLQWAVAGLVDNTSSDFVQSMKLLSKDEHRVVAVYDKNQKTAEEFAIIYKVPKICKNCSEISSNARVKVVFVNLPPEEHYKVVEMMLISGKSVLCQPPLGVNQKQTEKLISLAKKNGMFLMEGFWSRCFPIYKYLQDCFLSDVIGEVVHMQLDFGFMKPTEKLSGSAAYRGGILLHMGPTLFQFMQLVFHGLNPQAVVVGCNLKQSEKFFGVIVKYDQYKMAVLSASLLADLSNEGRAEEFAKTFRIPRSYEDYVGLSTDPDVDVVYVAVVSVLHYEVSKTMLSNGKHVLCEMPMGLNEKQVRKLIDLAKSQNCLLIEGIWSRFFPVYRAIRDTVSHGTIGEVVQVSAEIGYSTNRYGNTEDKPISGVSLLELALYLLQLQQIVFHQSGKPNMHVCTHITQSGLDSSFGIILVYPNDKICMLCLSTFVNLSGEATIYGTTGYIKVKDFWCPTSLTVNGSSKSFPLMKNPFPFNYHNGAGYAYEAEEVRSCILAGKIESQLMTHSESLTLIQLLDELRFHIGATFPEDSDVGDIDSKDNK